MPNNLKALKKFSKSFDESIIPRSISSCHFDLLTSTKAVKLDAFNGFREDRSPTDFCENMLKSLRSQSSVLETNATQSTARHLPDNNMTLSDAQLNWKQFPQSVVRENKEKRTKTDDISWTDAVDIGCFLRIQKPVNVDLKNSLNAEQNGSFDMQNITFVRNKANKSVANTECSGIEHAVAKTISPRKGKQPQLNLSFSIGQEGEGLNEFNEPVGVTVSPDGEIIVADYNNDRLQIFSSEGKFIRAQNHYRRESGRQFPFICPAGIACDSSGNIAVVEKGRNRLVVLSPGGVILHAFGRHGTEQRQFRGPHGISMDARNRIIVADTMNCRIQVFDPEGNFLFTFGDKGPGKLNYPCYAIFHEGRFYVADTDNDCVKVFDTRGTFLRTFGDGLSAPSGIAVYKSKYLLICDYSNDCVKVFSLDGRILSKFGTKGEGKDQFFGPEAIAVTPQGKIAVSDKLNFRIQVLDLVI